MEVHLFIFIYYSSKHVWFIFIPVLLVNSSFNAPTGYYILICMI